MVTVTMVTMIDLKKDSLDTLVGMIRDALENNDLSIKQIDMFIVELESLKDEFNGFGFKYD